MSVAYRLYSVKEIVTQKICTSNTTFNNAIYYLLASVEAAKGVVSVAIIY